PGRQGADGARLAADRHGVVRGCGAHRDRRGPGREQPRQLPDPADLAGGSTRGPDDGNAGTMMQGWVAAADRRVRRLRGLLSTSLLVLGVPGIASAQHAHPPLQAEAESIVAQAGGEWGVVAYSITSGKPLISINGSMPLVPASNNKVFTAIWALDVLGPDYRFPTDLLIDGSVEGGVLRGDVIIRGSGDPAFGYPPRLGFDVFVEEPLT